MIVGELGGKIKLLAPPYTSASPTLFNQVTTSPSGPALSRDSTTSRRPQLATNRYYYVFYTALTSDGGMTG